jgi:hypothetical protein
MGLTQAAEFDIELVQQRRAKIVTLERSMQGHPRQAYRADQAHRHYFGDGTYCREIKLPADTVVTGKIHRFGHVNFVLGDVTEVTPYGERRITGCETFEAPAGTKRALAVHADTWWTTVHPNPTNERDIEKLEAMLMLDSFEQFDALTLEHA